MEMRILIMTMIWYCYIPDYTMYEIKDVVSIATWTSLALLL